MKDVLTENNLHANTKAADNTGLRPALKVLLLNGSPKVEKSNSLHLAKAFCNGIKETCKADITQLDVYRLNIKDCLGCFHCWSKTPGICCIHDDMEYVLAKILESDIIIWSFPLYYFGIPSKLKALMDRQLPLNLPFMEKDSPSGAHPHRYDMSSKKYVFTSTCGFFTAQGNYLAVDEQIKHMCGQNTFTSIYCGQGELFNVPQLKKRTDEYLSYVQKAGMEFITYTAISTATRKKLDELLLPRQMYESMADASWGVDKDNINAKSFTGASPISALKGTSPEHVTSTSGSDTNTDKKSLNQNIKPAKSRSEHSGKGLIFTKQMSALYNPSSWTKDMVLEFNYTDINEKYQILLKNNGYKVIDSDFVKADTIIETPLDVWQKIGLGELDGQEALMQHLFSVKGDFSVMMNWDKYFGIGTDEGKKPDKYSESKASNMNLLLIPWIFIWIFLSINPYAGGISGILLCSVIPFAYIKYRGTLFEYISIFSVSALCIMAITGKPLIYIIPLSYMIFGIIWTASTFNKIPLTAYYSNNDFGGIKAFKNPLFIKTNRILTAAWGILYLITPIWTYFLILSGIGAWIGALNSILPVFMGFFTNWFKNWYPAYYASKG